MVKKAFNGFDAERKKYILLRLKDEEFSKQLGVMERTGSVLIKGDSGHGKTTYMLRLVKAISEVEKVHICTPEEAGRHSFKRALDLNNMRPYYSRFTYAKDHYDDLFERLKRKRQKKVVIIDSIQVFFKGKKRDDYYKLINTFPDTLFIGISKVNSKGDVVGAVADEFYWDCQNRIDISNFGAINEKSRCGGNETEVLIINKEKWEERNLKLVSNG